MSSFIIYAIIAFGAVVAITGLVLLFLRGHDAAESSFELFGQKVRVSSTGLVVFVVGSGLLLAPLYLRPLPQLEVVGTPGDRPATPKGELGIYLPERISGEEAEPNDTTQKPNQIGIDRTYIGQLVTPGDVDFFVFKLAPSGPRNLKVQVRWRRA